MSAVGKSELLLWSKRSQLKKNPRDVIPFVGSLKTGSTLETEVYDFHHWGMD